MKIKTHKNDSNSICAVSYYSDSLTKNSVVFRFDYSWLGVMCDACMLTADETFQVVEVAITGTDGWRAEYVRILFEISLNEPSMN